MMPVLIPQLTMTMGEGTLVRWLKGEGTKVSKDEPLFEIETDKALAEVVSPAEGVLRKIVVHKGAVEVGATVAFIGSPSEPLPDVVMKTSIERKITGGTVSSGELRDETSAEATRATPAARRRARELGMDIRSVAGTGPQGRITQEDVERSEVPPAKSPQSLPGGTETRRVIAERMSEAWRKIPHIHIGGDLRAEGLGRALEKARNKFGGEITITDLLLFASASLLPTFRVLNAVWKSDRAEPQTPVNLAVAVHTDSGVVAPVIHHAEDKGLEAISLERRRLAVAALAGKLRLQEVSGGTFTVTNLGKYPVDFFVPIINYPQVAILAAGRLRNHGEVVGGPPTPALHMWVNLSVDHRVTDGNTAALFLQELEKLFAELANRI